MPFVGLIMYCNDLVGSISQWKFITLKIQHTTANYKQSAIKLSSVHLASTFTVSRGDEGTEAGGPLHAPALTVSRFPMLGP
jgi:hypothetical protein